VVLATDSEGYGVDIAASEGILPAMTLLRTIEELDPLLVDAIPTIAADAKVLLDEDGASIRDIRAFAGDGDSSWIRALLLAGLHGLAVDPLTGTFHSGKPGEGIEDVIPESTSAAD
jgi:hypothetical protein